MYFSFYDTKSGGFRKTRYDTIYIKAATIQEAVRTFAKHFDADPHGEWCACCGPDFSIDRVEVTPVIRDGIYIID